MPFETRIAFWKMRIFSNVVQLLFILFTIEQCLQDASICFDLIQSDSICFNMLWSASICFNLIQYASICFDLLQSYSICFDLLQYASICWHLSSISRCLSKVVLSLSHTCVFYTTISNFQFLFRTFPQSPRCLQRTMLISAWSMQCLVQLESKVLAKSTPLLTWNIKWRVGNYFVHPHNCRYGITETELLLPWQQLYNIILNVYSWGKECLCATWLTWKILFAIHYSTNHLHRIFILLYFYFIIYFYFYSSLFIQFLFGFKSIAMWNVSCKHLISQYRLVQTFRPLVKL